jgi:hypothetical protein
MADIGYKVLTGSDGKLWVAKLRKAGTTPAGKRTHWEGVNTAGDYRITRDTSDPLPDTPDGAILEYQRGMVVMCGLRWRNHDTDEVIQRVIEAEALKAHRRPRTRAEDMERVAESCFV